MAFEKAKPAFIDPSIICSLTFISLGFCTNVTMFSLINRMASRACISVKGPAPVETNASIACTNASIPVQALRKGSIVIVVSGSIKATSGTTALLTMEILIFSTGSEMIANCETSAEVPAVVGMKIKGGIGRCIVSMPS